MNSFSVDCKPRLRTNSKNQTPPDSVISGGASDSYSVTGPVSFGRIRRATRLLRLDCQSSDFLVLALHYWPWINFEPVFQDFGIDAAEVEVEGEVAFYELVGIEGRVFGL